jgi:hypothetical protein
MAQAIPISDSPFLIAKRGRQGEMRLMRRPAEGIVARSLVEV